MIMHKVPFFHDTIDDTYCYQIVLKMILKYYFPERDYSLDDLVKLTGKKEGMYTWPQYSYITMSELGFEVKVIDAFNYDEFIQHGVKYLEKEYGKEIAEEQDKHSDLKYEVENIKKLRNLIHKETRIPELDDIKDLLSNNYLIVCLVDNRKLVGHGGSHSVLIIGFESNQLVLHSPGHPKGEYCKYGFDIFNKAWASPNDKMKNIAAFKLQL
jgi:hypothetical protein